MPVGFNFNLTFGLKPQVDGIKIVTVYKRSIFQVEWLIATLDVVDRYQYMRCLWSVDILDKEHGGQKVDKENCSEKRNPFGTETLSFEDESENYLAVYAAIILQHQMFVPGYSRQLAVGNGKTKTT